MNHDELKECVTEVKAHLEDQAARLTNMEKSIKVLNEAHTKNETDHAEIKGQLLAIKAQISTFAKMITIAISAAGVLIAAANFYLSHLH